MRLPRFANPARRRFPFDTLTSAGVARTARAPSYRGPKVADLHDPATFRPPELPRLSEAERRLLDAVLADPDADAPRLAYADWAERQGDGVRAASIRGQVGGGDSSSVGASAGDVSTFLPWGARDFVVRRGFVEGMSLSGRAFISTGAGLFRLTPLRELRLVAVQPFVAELARCPHLANLRRLDLSGARIGAAGVRELAASAYLGGLTELDLAGNDLTAAGLAALRAAPWFRNLESLGLADNGLAARDLASLLTGAGGELTAVDFSGNDLAGGFDVARATGFRRLRLSRCGMGADGVKSLLRAIDPNALDDLDLSFNAVGTAGAAALAGTASQHLTTLDVSFNDLEDAGAAALAAAGMTSLVALNLAGNRLTAAGAAAIAGAGSFGVVETLDLSTNPLGDAGAATVLRAETFAGVTRLRLANCGVTDAGVARLTADATIGRVRELSLAWNPFGDAGVTALAACPHLAGLRELDLTGTRLGFAGAVALADSPHPAALRTLAFGENPRLPPDAAALLRRRFGTITPVAPR